MEVSKEQTTDTTAVEEIKDSNMSETATVDESPSRSKDLSKTLPEEAFNNFIQGKRHMLVQDYQFAVQSLTTACELYAKHFGELAIECGEVYFLYGKALIRLSQQQTGILGDAINKAAPVCNDDDEEDSSEEEEKENGSESGEDKEKENGENGKSDAAGEDNDTDEKEPSESTDSPKTVVDAENKESEKETSESNEATADVTLHNETATEENQEQEPEEDDLELAWNTLETAKTIFSRETENKDSQLKVAEILQLLAEISMETDNYVAAIKDLQSCLCIQRKYLEPDNRLLAHTYYEMGLAHMLQKQYDGALENFTKTLEIFNLRRDNLEKAPIPETVGGFEAADRQKEIEDIDSIITDIREKIEDTKELVRNAKNELQEVLIKREMQIEADLIKSEKTESNSKPVSNITHLLKRKKPDEEEKDTESKRIKISNGDATVTK